jgi:hypothetical protein
MESLDGRVGLFFVVEGRVFLYACPLDRASWYGNFLTYPFSHDAVWGKALRARHKVDFDYYPRGRIVYDVPNGKYTVYHDRCCERAARLIGERLAPRPVEYALDEHYQCHGCNPAYVK